MRKLQGEIQLEIIKPEGAAQDEYLAAAIVGGVRKPALRMRIAAYGRLYSIGGNPARYFEPADPLWWLGFMEEGRTTVQVSGVLAEA